MLPDDTIPLPRHRRFDSGGFVAGVLALVLLGFGGLILGLAYGQRGGSTASPADVPAVPAPPSATSRSDDPGPADAAIAGPPVPVVLPSPSDEKPRQSQGTAGSNNTRVAGGAATAAGKVKAKKPHRSSGLLRRR